MSTRTMPSIDANSGSTSIGEEQAMGEQARFLPSVGEQLRTAREARGLAIADIANMLKLSPRQIEALEADDWNYLPCTTINRGFVRNYARALKLDAAALMASLDTVAMPAAPELEMPAETNVRVPVERSLARRDYLRVFSGAVVLLLALLAYFLFPQDFFQTALSHLQSSRPFAALSGNQAPVAEKSAELAISTPAMTPTVTDALPAAADPASVTAAAAAAPSLAPVASPAPAAASAQALKFTFREAAWVEIRDRSGEIIFSQLSQPGTQREIEGKPPYALVVGNAGHVSLTYKGKPVDLSKRSKDDVARVTLE